MVEETTKKSEEEKEVSSFEIEEPKIYSASLPYINTKFQSYKVEEREKEEDSRSSSPFQWSTILHLISA